MANNNWTITEIDAHLMPPAGHAKWWQLFQEIVLRLEQTGEKFALEIKLPDGGGKAAQTAVARFANNRLGKDALILAAVTHPDGSSTLYVRRGPNCTL